ncbi:flagellar basal body-associated FliL family protein [Paenirhodobacter sp.]|uniref:flagellar basal body-associated FliL family protein n=1 Tax=Paenirhodobacter sp. TaxID=1965326 RepID=UPI003B41A61B
MAQMDAALEAPKKKSLLPLLIGIVLMLVLGGGAFYAVYSGLVLGGHESAAGERPKAQNGQPPVSFVALDPMVISLGESGARHLRFSAQLEVEPRRAAEVELLKPRVMDVLNGYLRAVDITQLEDPSALIRLRAQMLRRIQIVTGEGIVRDLLIIEFVMN